jgi:uncharacterized protein (DUF885 family)
MTDSLPHFQQLLTDSWNSRMELDPLFATECGDRRYNDRLPEAGEAAAEHQRQAYRDALSRLAGIPRGELPPAEQVNHDVFGHVLQGELAVLETGLYRMNFSKRAGFHTRMLDVLQLTPFESEVDYQAYLTRLRAFLTFTRQNIALLREGLRAGFTPARATLTGALETVIPHIVTDPSESLFFQPFRSFPSTVPEPARARLQEAARQVILTSVVPAFRELGTFLADEYLPGGVESVAATALPDGAHLYETMVRFHTTTDLGPRQIHETGLAEVRRIRGEMQALLERLNFNGSLAEFIQFLRSDPRFYVDTPAQLLKEAAIVLKRMDGELPRLFGRLPRTPYGIREIPAYLAPGSTTAYYFPPPGDGSQAGFYYVNTYELKSRPLYEIEALSLHEAVPGHHLQVALQQELAELPTFRRFAMFTAYVEGWALYAERLGLEVGFYTDPYSDFGRLTYEMWRACRLVVDTGMHALGWTRQQAIDFMAENTALTLLNIANEVDRYIAWPGQALAYKIGELKIRELRARAEAELGGRFDRRAFHDLLLGSGPVPLSLLEQWVVEWINDQKGPPS